MATDIIVTLGEGKTEAEYKVRDLDKGFWSFWKLNTPSHYVANLRDNWCDCPDSQYRKRVCKHLIKARELEKEKQMAANNGTALAPTQQQPNIAEIVVRGNLASLNEQERAAYYLAVCNACGLNPALKPFEFINMKGKVVLYALKSCTEQLRKNNNVNLTILSQELKEGLYIVRVKAELPGGRADEDLGAVAIGNETGEDRANLIMKCITKAKRRVTLSICGLGMLDETEVSSVMEGEQRQFPTNAPNAAIQTSAQSSPAQPAKEQDSRSKIEYTADEFHALMQRKGKKWQEAQLWMDGTFGTNYHGSLTSIPQVDSTHLGGWINWLNTNVSDDEESLQTEFFPKEKAAKNLLITTVSDLVNAIGIPNFEKHLFKEFGTYNLGDLEFAQLENLKTRLEVAKQKKAVA
jgi:hypothetical protein